MNIQNLEDALSNAAYSGVTYTSNTSSDCVAEGCDGICRCTKINSVTIESIDISSIVHSAFYMPRKKKNQPTLSAEETEILKYCFDRLLRIHKVYETDSWEASTTGGYYGEEIGKIYLCETTTGKIVSAMEALSKQSLAEKVEYLLEEEYGYLLDSVKGKEWSVETVDRNLINLGQEEYGRKVKEEDLAFYREFYLPRGIAIKSGDRYRLIDGYHRCLATKDEEILLIVGV